MIETWKFVGGRVATRLETFVQSLKFNENQSIGLGVELEIQLVDTETGDLKPAGPLILESLKYNAEARHIKSEIFQSMLELDTPICTNAFEVGESFRKSLNLVRLAAASHGADVMMSGTHPFANYSERLLTPSSRYYTLVDRNKWITRRLQIFGLHVHIGMKNGDHAIAMNNALCHYLPVLLALSASSPFWHREDTGLASSRITFFEAIPTGGHPYLLNSWKEFEDLIEKMIFSKSISSLKDLWWDIRPNVEFGTIEVRIADCPPTLKETEALVALMHSLAIFIDQELMAGRKFSPPPEWILRENKWRSSRHGLQCDLIQDMRGTSVSFTRVWQEIKTSLKPVISHFGYQNIFEFLDSVVSHGPSYARQREHFTGDYTNVVRHLIDEGVSDHPKWILR